MSLARMNSLSRLLRTSLIETGETEHLVYYVYAATKKKQEIEDEPLRCRRALFVEKKRDDANTGTSTFQLSLYSVHILPDRLHSKRVKVQI